MRTVFGTGRATRLLPVLVAALGATALGPQRAGAQFFWDQPRMTADDAARAVMQRGFRPIHRPFRNSDVYVADVIDRRGRQERLIISADSGDIVQRFYIEGGRAVGREADPTLPPGPVPPRDIPNQDSRPSLFSRLFGGDGADQKPETPDQFGPNYALPPPPAPQPRPKRVPRVVERAPETVAPSTPIESAPLTPAPTPAAPAVTSASPPPSQPNPAAAAVVPIEKPRVPSKDPLAIPGSKEDDEKTAAKPATFAVARPAKVAPAAAPKAADPAPVDRKSVPVAPLD